MQVQFSVGGNDITEMVVVNQFPEVCMSYNTTVYKYEIFCLFKKY